MTNVTGTVNGLTPNFNIAMLQSSERPQGNQQLKDVIDKLAQALTKQDGSFDSSSPLGKMLSDHMQAKGLPSDGPGDLQKGLESLISEKLGPNFGAASALEPQGGADGTQNLLSKVLNGLAKVSLDDLLTKQGDGTQFNASDKQMLDKVADFMDANPSQFPKPDSRSWKDELSEDNHLNKRETETFRAALDKLGSQLDANAAGVPQGGFGGLSGVGDLSSGQGSGTTRPTASAPQSGQAVQQLHQLLDQLIAQIANGDGPQVGAAPNLLGALSSRQNQQALSSSTAQTANALAQALLQRAGPQITALS